MHRLTIDRADHRTIISAHSDDVDAKYALARYIEHADCRSDAIQTHHDFSSWFLIALADNRVHATATIERYSTTETCGPPKAVRDNAPRVGPGITCIQIDEPTAVQGARDELNEASRSWRRASRPRHHGRTE